MQAVGLDGVLPDNGMKHIHNQDMVCWCIDERRTGGYITANFAGRCIW